MADRPQIRTPSQQSGDDAEDLIAGRLTAAGWTVLARNLRLGREEVDLLAIDPAAPALVVVEVRWRRSRAFGLAEETLDWRKRRHLRTAAFGLIDSGHLPDGRPLPKLPLRIDLVVVEPAPRRDEPVVVRHHRNVVGD
jgi:putative endonuclease